MQCQACGADLGRAPYIKLEWEDFAVDLFCDSTCLRAYLEASAPLTAAKRAVKISGLSPQDVVVCEHQTIARVGEGLWWCTKCRALVEVSGHHPDR